MEYNNRATDNPILVFGVGIFLVFFLILPMLYATNRELFNAIILEISLFQLGFFTHFSEKAIENYQTILAFNPADMSWQEVKTVLRYSGALARYPFMLLLLIMGIVAIFLKKKNNLYRQFSMKSLSEHNQEFYPCIAPVVGKGDYLQSTKSFDEGHWKIARTPVQFCVENKLVTYPDEKEITWQDTFKNGLPDMDLPAYGNMVLQKEKCNTVFLEQLSNKTRAFEELPIERQVFVSAFLAYGNDDKETAIKMFNTCSLSYIEDDKPTCKCFSDKEFIKFVQETYAKYADIKSKFIARHLSYELPYLMALLYFARKKGILASSQFLFLRPIDRPLWYTLHQCGGQTAWAEGLAPWLHFQDEENENKTLTEFKVENGYEYMHKVLAGQGWLLEAEEEESVSEGDDFDE